MRAVYSTRAALHVLAASEIWATWPSSSAAACFSCEHCEREVCLGHPFRSEDKHKYRHKDVRP